MNDMTSTLESQTNHDAEPVSPIRVWDLPTRVFHWSLAISFAGAWLTAESERWRNIHVVLGYTLAGLIVFRIVWGLVGSRYARFGSFVFPPSRMVSYLKSLLSASPEHHAGHNPAGALAIFGLLALGAVTVISGYATFQEIGGEWLEELHEGAANAMLVLVLIHIAGVVVSSFLHKENLARSMLTGWKMGRDGEGIDRTLAGPGIILLALVVFFLGFSQTATGRALIFSSQVTEAKEPKQWTDQHDRTAKQDRHERRDDD